MNKWTNEQMNKWTNEQMNKWTNEQMNKWNQQNRSMINTAYWLVENLLAHNVYISSAFVRYKKKN